MYTGKGCVFFILVLWSLSGLYISGGSRDVFVYLVAGILVWR